MRAWGARDATRLASESAMPRQEASPIDLGEGCGQERLTERGAAKEPKRYAV